MSAPIEKEMLNLSRRLCLALGEMISPPALDLFYTYDALTTVMNCPDVIDEDLRLLIIQEGYEAAGIDAIRAAEAIAERTWREKGSSGAD